MKKPGMRVLVVDIGGTNVKILATGQTTFRKVPSGRELTPQKMVSEVARLAGDWEYDVVAIGYPGRVVDGRIAVEPPNLGHGWVGFDFNAAFGHRVKIVNDAAMQALGSYKSGLERIRPYLRYSEDDGTYHENRKTSIGFRCVQ